ncbi:MAG: prolipoprotein diacylglyceryl transferase [Solirubrobacterales bacterium]
MLAAIPSPASSGFQLGPFEVHVYGLMYAVGLLAAVAIAIRRWEGRGGSRQTVYDVAKWGFPAGIVGGRLYFYLTSSSEVPAHWWGPFAVWDGGMGIWGGIALGTLVGIWRLRRAGVSVAEFMDAAGPAPGPPGRGADAGGRNGRSVGMRRVGRRPRFPFAA